MEVKNSEAKGLTAKKRAEFEKEFQWLAREKKWTEQDIADARAAMASDPGLIRYLWVLARAMKQGYRCVAETGYQKLIDFCAQNGLPSPLSKRDV